MLRLRNSRSVSIYFLLLRNNSLIQLHRLPRLNPGSELPRPYFNLTTSEVAAPALERDPDSEELAKIEGPKPPSGAPELNASGRPITKRERREVSVHGLLPHGALLTLN